MVVVTIDKVTRSPRLTHSHSYAQLNRYCSLDGLHISLQSLPLEILVSAVLGAGRSSTTRVNPLIRFNSICITLHCIASKELSAGSSTTTTECLFSSSFQSKSNRIYGSFSKNRVDSVVAPFWMNWMHEWIGCGVRFSQQSTRPVRRRGQPQLATGPVALLYS